MSLAWFFNDYRKGAAHVILVCFLPVVTPRLGGVVVAARCQTDAKPIPNRCQTDAHLNVLAAQATCGLFMLDCFPNVSIGFPVVCV